MSSPLEQPRILFVSYTAEWTGPTNSLLLLIRHLRNRFDISVVLPGPAGIFLERLMTEGIRTHTVDSLDKTAIPPLLRLIRRERIDLVYGNDTSGASRNALIAAKLLRVPFICHLRAMARSGDWRGRGFLRFADAAIAVSEACARSHGRYVSERAVHVVYNGVDLPPGRSNYRLRAREYLHEQADLPPDAFVIMAVGHLSARKAQQRLVRALEPIAAAAPSARLVLVGHVDRDAAYTAETRALAHQLGVGDHVRFMGFRQDLDRLLPGADLYLHAAIKDPHPRSVIEAMAAELPVVASAVDGVAETVIDGQTGYLVAPGSIQGLVDAVLQLLRDPAKRRELGVRGRERALHHFSAETTARQVGEIIEARLKRATPGFAGGGDGDPMEAAR